MHERKSNLRQSDLRLRFAIEVFEDWADAHDLPTDADRARFLNVPEPTYHRISRGSKKGSDFIAPGNRFIASAKFAIRDVDGLTFDDLFPIESGEATAVTEEESPLLRRREAARYLRVGTTKLDELIKEKAIPVVRIGTSVLVKRADADAFVASLQPV